MKIYETVTGWFLGLDAHILRGMLLAVMVTAGGLLAVAFYRLWKKGIRLKEEKAGQKIYENMEEAFREKAEEPMKSWLPG